MESEDKNLSLTRLRQLYRFRLNQHKGLYVITIVSLAILSDIVTQKDLILSFLDLIESVLMKIKGIYTCIF